MGKRYFSKEQLEFQEIIKETQDYKIMIKCADLSVAATIKGLLEWCDELEKRGFASITPNSIRAELNRYADDDPTVRDYLSKIQNKTMNL